MCLRDSKELSEVVIDYAKNAELAGLDGVVCSPLEAGKIHEACGKHFATVTPGIRFADSKADDQVRITTPARAREIGSDSVSYTHLSPDPTFPPIRPYPRGHCSGC